MFNSTENQKEDIVPIAKIGENSICLAYYFYDLCDEYGIVVWNMFDFEGDARSEGERSSKQRIENIRSMRFIYTKHGYQINHLDISEEREIELKI